MKTRDFNSEFEKDTSLTPQQKSPLKSIRKIETSEIEFEQFNPDTHIVVKKSDWELLNFVKMLPEIWEKLCSVYDYVELVKYSNIKIKTAKKIPLSREEKSIKRKTTWLQPKKRF